MKVLNKSFYIPAGLAMIVIGALSMWQTYSVINNPVKKVNLDNIITNNISACYNKAAQENKFNFDVEFDGPENVAITGKKIVIKTTDISNWDAKFFAASQIVSECQGMKMASFCFGEECDIDGVAETKELGMKMVLEYDKASEIIVAK